MTATAPSPASEAQLRTPIAAKTGWLGLRAFSLQAGAVMTAKALGLAAGLAAQLVLARWLGVTEYGVTATLGSLCAAALIVGKAGFEPLTMRYVALYRASGDGARLAGFRHTRRLRTLAVTLGLFILGAIALALLALSSRLVPLTSLAAGLALATLPLGVILELAAAELKACDRAAGSELALSFWRPFFASILGCIAWYLFPVGNAAGAAAILLLAAVAGSALTSWQARRARAGEPANVAPHYEAKVWNRAALLFTWMGVCQALIAHADIALLAWLTSPREAGIYAAAVRIAQLPAFGLLAATAVGAPAVARLCVHSQRHEMQRAAQHITWLAAGCGLPLALGLGLCGPWVLGWFGSEFSAGFVPLLVLLMGQVVSAWCGAAGYLLTMTGHHAAVARTLTLTAVLQLALVALLAPSLGAVGAACAASLAMALRNVALVLAARAKLNIHSALWWPRRRRAGKLREK